MAWPPSAGDGSPTAELKNSRVKLELAGNPVSFPETVVLPNDELTASMVGAFWVSLPLLFRTMACPFWKIEFRRTAFPVPPLTSTRAPVLKAITLAALAPMPPIVLFEPVIRIPV